MTQAPLLRAALGALLLMAEPVLAQPPTAKPVRPVSPRPAPAPAPSTASSLSLLQLPAGALLRMRCTAEQVRRLNALRVKLEKDTQQFITTNRAKGESGRDAAYRQAQTARLKAESNGKGLLSQTQRRELAQLQAEFRRYEQLSASAYRLLAVKGLTSAQDQRLLELAAATQKTRRDLVTRARTDAERKRMAQQLRELELRTEAEVKSILDAKQQEAFDHALAPAGPASPDR